MEQRMSSIRVLVTGSRDYPDASAVVRALAAIRNRLAAGATMTVVHGSCPTGADAAAHVWCALPTEPGCGVTVVEEPHPASWSTCTRLCYHKPRPDGRCPAAGPRRNGEMVALGADVVLAFPLDGPRHLSRGTWDCVDRANAAGIPVTIHTPKAGGQ